MDHWKNRSEKNRSIRDLVQEEDVENQKDVKGEKRETREVRNTEDSEKKGHYGAPYAKEEQGELAT
jgi:hypothetical protein